MEIQEGSVADIKRKFRKISTLYYNEEKLSIARAIYLDMLNDYSPLLARDICYAVEDINKGVSRAMLLSFLGTQNKASRKVFEHVSGLELPKTNKGTKAFFSSRAPIVIGTPKPYKEIFHNNMNKYCILLSNGWYTMAYGVEKNIEGLDVVIRKTATGGYEVYSKEFFNFLRYGLDEQSAIEEVKMLITKTYNGDINKLRSECNEVLNRHLENEKGLNAFLGYEYNGL